MTTQVPISVFCQSLPGDGGVRDLLAEYYNSNRMFFCSAGNRADYPLAPIRYPANLPSTVAVGGISRLGDLFYKDVLGNLDFTANSVDLFTTTTFADSDSNLVADDCARVRGTSFSTPIVAGIAANLLKYNPDLYNDDIYELLKMSATYGPLSNPTPDSYEEVYGHGLVQGGAALDSLLCNSLVGGVEYGYDRIQSTNMGTRHVHGLPNAPEGDYQVTRYKLEKDIQFPTLFTNVPHVWGRGPSTRGSSLLWDNSSFIAHNIYHCDVVSGSPTTNGCTLETYTYRYQGDWGLFQFDFFFPTRLEDVRFGYAALGRDGIVSTPQDFENTDLGLSVFPNPSNCRTTFRLKVAEQTKGAIDVFDVKGRKVAQLFSGRLDEGPHSYIWDGKDSNGAHCASAVYFIKAKVGKNSASKSFVLLK